MDSMAKQHTFNQAYHMAKITSWLDQGGDVDCTSFSKLGHTMLQTACVENHEALVADLLRRGASVDFKGRGGKTALMHACIFGNQGCVQLCLRAGANPLVRSDVDDTDFTEYDGMTALEITEAEIQAKGARPRQIEIVRMLREAEQLQQRVAAHAQAGKVG